MMNQYERYREKERKRGFREKKSIIKRENNTEFCENKTQIKCTEAQYKIICRERD